MALVKQRSRHREAMGSCESVLEDLVSEDITFVRISRSMHLPVYNKVLLPTKVSASKTFESVRSSAMPSHVFDDAVQEPNSDVISKQFMIPDYALRTLYWQVSRRRVTSMLFLKREQAIQRQWSALYLCGALARTLHILLAI